MGSPPQRTVGKWVRIGKKGGVVFTGWGPSMRWGWGCCVCWWSRCFPG